MSRSAGLARSVALAVGLALAAALTLDAQDAKTREPKRPKLDAGRDTNSAGAYHQYGMLNLSKRPRSAADAFYWATRLDPSLAEPWYGRWCALLLEMQRRDMFALVNDEPRYSKEVAKIDSLRYQALLREPLLYTKLDAVIVHDFFSALSLATDGEVGEIDIGSVSRTGAVALASRSSNTRSRFPRGRRRVSCMQTARARSSRCSSTTARRPSSTQNAWCSSSVSRLWSGCTTARRCSSTASAGCARPRATTRVRAMRTADLWWRTSPSIPGTSPWRTSPWRRATRRPR